MIGAISNLRFCRNDQDKFADLFRARLAATGERRPIRSDRSDFSLHVGVTDAADRRTIRLHNLFASFTHLNPAERLAALSRIAASIVESGRPAVTVEPK